MARVLITGIKGVVGSKIASILRSRGHHVFGIDLKHTYDDNYERCDIGEYRQLERVFSKHGSFDFVYNCAAEFGRWNGEDYYEQLWKTNAVGTKHVVRLQEQLKFKLIHFSSSEVYGDYSGVMSESVMDEFPIKQMNDYAMTKWVNEMQINNSRIMYNTETVVVRLFNTYGPGETFSPYRSVNCRFCYCALKGLPITVFKGHHRTSTYLDDAATTLSNISNNFIDGQKYNIGGTEYHSIEELADIIWDYTGADRYLITYKDSEILTTKSKTLTTDRSEKELDHKLTVSLKDGVHRTIDWMKDYYRI